MNRFEGKVALVTGAASGMGRATCVRLASEGASIYGIDVNEAGLKSVTEEIQAAGGAIKTQLCNVAKQEECAAAVAAAVSEFGRLDTLANVAGIVRFNHTTDLSADEWNLVLAINLSGPLYLSQAAIPHLIEAKGSIVNVCSNAGLMGQAFTAAYCASKGGLVQLTKSMAMEYMKQTIRINAVCPGGTDTAMNESINFPEGIDFDLVDRYTGKRGFSTPEDLASAIAYLASDEAGSVHGSIFSVDNGIMAG